MNGRIGSYIDTARLLTSKSTLLLGFPNDFARPTYGRQSSFRQHAGVGHGPLNYLNVLKKMKAINHPDPIRSPTRLLHYKCIAMTDVLKVVFTEGDFSHYRK